MILQSPTFPKRQPPMTRASSSRIWEMSVILRSIVARWLLATASMAPGESSPWGDRPFVLLLSE